MGQSGCSEVSKAEQERGQATASGGKKAPPPEKPKAQEKPTPKKSPINGVALPPVNGMPEKNTEPPEITRLRAELRSKELALQAVQKGADGHVALIEALEREAFQKDEAIGKLRASEAAQREVATLIAELRKRDDDIDKLRRRATSEEATLRSLTAEAQTKGDVVEDLVVAISEQSGGPRGAAETTNGTVVEEKPSEPAAPAAEAKGAEEAKGGEATDLAADLEAAAKAEAQRLAAEAVAKMEADMASADPAAKAMAAAKGVAVARKAGAAADAPQGGGVVAEDSPLAPGRSEGTRKSLVTDETKQLTRTVLAQVLQSNSVGTAGA